MTHCNVGVCSSPDHCKEIGRCFSAAPSMLQVAVAPHAAAGPYPTTMRPATVEEAARRADLVPGVMRCAKCKFELQRMNLNVNVGTVTAGDNKTEPCPNGCGPLWPKTWEQEARSCWKTLEELAERAFAAEKIADREMFICMRSFGRPRGADYLVPPPGAHGHEECTEAVEWLASRKIVARGGERVQILRKPEGIE